MHPSRLRILKPHLPIFILILLNLLVGIAIVQDYGESWDEAQHNTYGRDSLQAYSDLFTTGKLHQFTSIDPVTYGPAFSMVNYLSGLGFHAFFPKWSELDGRHFVEFISFQIGILSLYFLSKKWLSNWAAFGTSLLFSTQPLLWGHAFMNPKDIPFMAFFLASLTLGVYMVDALPASLSQVAHQQPDRWSFRHLQVEWRHDSSLKRKIVSVLSIIYLLPIISMITGTSNRLVRLVITDLYNMDKMSPLGRWFIKFATNAGSLPLDNYIYKAQLILLRWEIEYLIAGLLIGIMIFPLIFPLYFKRFVQHGLVPFPGHMVHLFLNPLVLTAALVLGFTTSIRIAGPYAGILVIFYAMYKSWRKAILLVIPYASIALLTCFLTWPYLWAGPVDRLLDSIILMSRFPFQGKVLFQGLHYIPSDLPKFFLPYMMSIQLTEVVFFLFVFGFVLSILNLLKGRQLEPFFLTITWLVIPILLVIINRSTVYDNFRQFLFLLPPIFIIGGIGLDAILKQIKWNQLKVLILCALVIPGVYAGIRLHPYQYVYYNSFVGGVRGANHLYEMDYWATSYREAALYINAHAPKNAYIAVLAPPIQDFQDYVRPDLTITPLWDPRGGVEYSFIVAYNRLDNLQSICKSANQVKTIGREGVVFAVIKIAPVFISSDCP